MPSMRKLSLLVLVIVLAAVIFPACAGSSGTIAIGDKEATSLMYDFLGPDENKAQSAVAQVLEIGDVRFVSVFMELMRMRQVGLLEMSQDLYQSYISAMAVLGGEDFGYHWADWVEWYGKTDLKPPPEARA